MADVVYDYVYVTAPSGETLFFGDSSVVWRGLPAGVMPAGGGLPLFSEDDYAEALANLLPTGPAWPRTSGLVLMMLLRGLAVQLARVEARAGQLYAEVDPATTSELLLDWERLVGLPDPCVTEVQTVGQRRAALAGRLTTVGMQSREFFVSLAQRLGFTVTIDEFASAGDATAAGIVFTGDQWAHIWRVNVSTAVAVTPFRVGAGAAGEPLRSWGNEVLECQFARFKPAHTQVLFAYPT